MSKLYQRLPKYIQIKETIRTEIEKGVLKEGEQLPSEAALIDRFSASKMTVIRSLQELVQEGYLRRIQGRGTFVLRPEPDTPLIGVLIPGLVSGIFSIILKSIETKAHQLGYGIMLCSADEDFDKVESFARQLIERKAAGVIAAPLERVEDISQNQRWYKMFKDENIPVVLVDRDIPEVHDTILVDTNNEEAMQNLTEEVIRHGHRRILFVTMKEITSTTTNHRIEGFNKAVSNLQDKVDLAKIVTFSERTSYTENLEEFEKYLYDFEPTVVLTSHDILAVQVLGLLKSASSDLGTDISLTGFDDLPFSESIGLTTVRQPSEAQGHMAVQLLDRAIKGENIQSVQLPSKVIVRSSLQPPAIPADQS